MEDTILYGLLNKKIKAAESGTSSVPTKLSELSDDSNHRTVSDIEKATWNNKSDFSGDYNDLINTPSSLPASDVYEWAKQETKPTYTSDEIGADPEGSAATAEANAKQYSDDRFTDLIGTSPENLDTIYELGNAVTENQNAIDAIEAAITNKVDKIKGKELSTNDLTDALKNDYDSAVEHMNSQHAPVNAQENVIESISVNGISQQIINKNIDLPSYSPSIIPNASGKSILITDGSENTFENFNVYGRTMQQTTTGAQLFDKSTITEHEYVSDTDGSILKPQETSGNYNLTVSDFINVHGMSSVFIGNTTMGRWGAFYNADKEFISGITGYNKAYEVPENAYFMRLTVSSDSVGTLMVNTGTTALPYEPYTGGQPSPNPDYPQELVSAGDKGDVNIDVSVGGRNLLLRSTTKKIETYSGATASFETGVAVPEWGATDAIRVYGTGGTSATFAVLIGVSTPSNISVDGENYVHSVYIKNNGSETLTITNNFIEKAKTVQPGEITRAVIPGVGNGRNILQFNFATSVTGDAFDFTYWHPKIEIGTEVTDWTPAPEDNGWPLSLSTPNGLPGIPVSSGGNYTDENGQQWICDEIDFGRGVYVQRIGRRELTGNEIWFAEGTTDADGYIYIYTEIKPKFVDASMCSHAKWLDKAEGGTWDDGFYTNSDPGYSASGYFEIRTQMAIKEWKSYLQALYDDGNPVVLQYALSIIKETDLSADELAAYRVLHTNTPTTTITNDEDCWMQAKYIADPENYIAQNYMPKESYNALEQRVAALETQILESI